MSNIFWGTFDIDCPLTENRSEYETFEYYNVETIKTKGINPQSNTLQWNDSFIKISIQ